MKLLLKDISILSNIVYQVPPKTIRMAGIFSRFNQKITVATQQYAPQLRDITKKMEFINGFLNQNKPNENEVKSEIFLKKEIELKGLRKQLQELHDIELDIDFGKKECDDMKTIIEFGFESQLIIFAMIDSYLELVNKLNQ